MRTDWTEEGKAFRNRREGGEEEEEGASMEGEKKKISL